MGHGRAKRRYTDPKQPSGQAYQWQFAWTVIAHSTLHLPSKHEKNMASLYISNDAQNVYFGPY